MSVFRCKMCGGDLTVTQEMTVCECQYCGSKQTLPRISDEKKNNLYDRAGHFRRNNEYDKAMAIYEQILNEDTEDAESYWSIVLCKYGIEYVEDPATHRRVPTVNRAQLTSVFMDENYKSALKYADAEQRAVYEAEAREIEQIQKGILEISSKEESFDVFICYKESDAAGRRTPDSVLANDLYHQLIQEGFKVFFARITLEDKLGSAYEPYIFAALNSAKVMVVLGTRPEYFSAVWVKNEWSRFLTQIKSGAKKALIPAYKDMDPYDLPEEFSHLQAQDMSKLGFMQDLIRGIKKIVGTEEKASENKTIVVESATVSSEARALVERAFLFLEDGEFGRADELFERALNQEPQNAKAYVGKLMIERRLCRQEDLSKGLRELTGNNYFEKAMRFAEEGLKKELKRCNEMIMDNKKEIVYNDALQLVKASEAQGGIRESINVLDAAIAKYESLLGWRDSAKQIEECNAKKNAYFDRIYQDTKGLIEKIDSNEIPADRIMEAMGWIIGNLQYLEDYRNSKELLVECIDRRQKHEERVREEKRLQAEKALRRRRKIIIRLVIGLFICAICGLILVGIAKFITELPPSDKTIRADAEQYIFRKFEGEFSIEELSIEKEKKYSGYCVTVYADLKDTEEDTIEATLELCYYDKKKGRYVNSNGLIIDYSKLPPNDNTIRSDAEAYLMESFGDEYIIQNLLFDKNEVDSGYNVFINAELINKMSNDNVKVTLQLDYFEEIRGRYVNSASEETARKVFLNHVICEKDEFTMPAFQLSNEGISSNISQNEFSRLIANGQAKVSYQINYLEAVVDGNQADVPVKVHIDYLNSCADTEVTVQYYYCKDFHWETKETVKVQLVPKGSLLDEAVIEQAITGNDVIYEQEELSSEYLSFDGYTVEYYDGFTKAKVGADFTWKNERDMFSGNVDAVFQYLNESWTMVRMAYNNMSKPVRHTDISDDELLSILNSIVVQECSKCTDVSNLTLLSKESSNNILTVEIQYNSVDGSFLIKNTVVMELGESRIQGYKFRKIRSEETSALSIANEKHGTVQVKYRLNYIESKPTNMKETGEASLRVDIDKSRNVNISGTVGTVSLNVNGKLIYPDHSISATGYQQSIRMTYWFLIYNSSDLTCNVTPKLKFSNNRLTGKIVYDFTTIGVNDFEIILE